MDQVYAELRSLAAAYLRRERAGHTLQPTELVHEAYLRLERQAKVDLQGRTHFFALGARAMRRILVEHARRRRARKRGGDLWKVTLDESAALADDNIVDVLAIDEVLTRLAALDPLAAEIVQLRIFGGLKWDEVAAELEISERWARAEWTHARAWLRRALGGSGGQG